MTDFKVWRAWIAELDAIRENGVFKCVSCNEWKHAAGCELATFLQNTESGRTPPGGSVVNWPALADHFKPKDP